MKIRRLQKEDLQTRVEWMNNEKVYSSMHFSVPVVMENTVRWFENNIGNEKRADVAFEEDGEIVAFGGLTGVDPTLKKAELYIFVNPNIQAKGYGTKATMLLCEYGFNEMGLHNVLGQCRRHLSIQNGFHTGNNHLHGGLLVTMSHAA